MTTPPNETLGAFLSDVAEKIAKAERAAIVAWLRAEGWLHVAKAIEAGEHDGAPVASAVVAVEVPATCGKCKHWVKTFHTDLGICTHPAIAMENHDFGDNGRHPPKYCPLRKVQP